jgi:hypothetical protein
VRAGDQLALARVHLEIVHRHVRQVAAESLPARATVGGHVHAAIAADVEHVGVDRVLAYDIQGLVRQARGDRPPAAAHVVRDVDVGAVVVVAIAVQRDIGALARVVRGLHAADPAIGGQRPGDVAPLLRVAARDPDLAVVGAGPQLAERRAATRSRW